MDRLVINSILAGVVLFILVMVSKGGASAATAIAVAGSVLVQLLQLGVGIRSLLTGMRADILQSEKVRVEIERLASGISADAVQIEKARVEMEKTREELRKLLSRIYEPEAIEVIKYGRGEAVNPRLVSGGKEGSIRK